MRCPACASDSTEHVWTARDRLFRTTGEVFEMRRCGGCGVLFLGPPPTEPLSRYYPDRYWTGPTRGVRHRLTERYRRAVLRHHVRFVGEVLVEQRRRGIAVRLLDLGCGDGSILAAVGAPDVVGVDDSSHAVRAARARGLDVVRGSVVAPPFRDGSFSVVTMFHVLEHVADPATPLRAARALLGENGDLVVQVPDTTSWQAISLGPRWSGFDVPRHLVNYSPPALRHVLAAHGFEVVRETRVSLRDDLALLASSLVPGLYPPVRAVRRSNDGLVAQWIGDLAYLAIAAALLPVVLVGMLSGRGATVMIHAHRVPSASG